MDCCIDNTQDIHQQLYQSHHHLPSLLTEPLSNMSTDAMVTLVTPSNIKVRTTIQAAKQSRKIKTNLEGPKHTWTVSQPITIPEMTADTLEKLVEWCEIHCDDEFPALGVDYESEWDAAIKELKDTYPLPELAVEFFRTFDHVSLFALMEAAYSMDIPRLLGYGLNEVHRRLSDMNREEFREVLGIDDDFMLEDEEYDFDDDFMLEDEEYDSGFFYSE
ncbi:hypothetical protein GGS21DRAFT_530698 [Xylaria nigripes]|nr:hypothetical protein GGS21DRAFT_530698 [Xylaria nigripes]